MNTKRKKIPSPEGRQQLETLRRAVSKTLEKKRRLGQYAVIWKDGKLLIQEEDAATSPSSPSS